MSNAPITKSVAGAAIQREEFGARQIEQRRETASTAVAAQAQATIQARYIMALQRPRSWDDVRTKLLHACESTAFADRAMYFLERGNKRNDAGDWVPNIIEGLTIRFAESVIRTAGNVLSTTRTTYDDEEKRIVNVSVTDLETNAIYEKDLIIDKTVERSKAEGRILISQRTNSYGKPVYIVEATEDELLQKEGVVVSKTVRTLMLRFLPPDIADECIAKIKATRKSEVEIDPDAARKNIFDNFAKQSIKPSDLSLWLGHDVGQCSPAELDQLRGLFDAIREGEVTWADALAEKAAPTDESDPKTKAPGKVASTIADRVKARAAAKGRAAPTATGNAVAKGEAKAEDPKPTADPKPETDKPKGATAAEHRRVAEERKAGKRPAPEFPGDKPAALLTECLTCGVEIDGAAVTTTNADGVQGLRHPSCPSAADVPTRQP